MLSVTVQWWVVVAQKELLALGWGQSCIKPAHKLSSSLLFIVRERFLFHNSQESGSLMFLFFSVTIQLFQAKYPYILG